MRHGKRFNHLGRQASHRKAMLSNMASSLIENKRITTTVAKAKALRKYIEPLLTRAKSDTMHSRRVVFSYLQDKYAIQTLFDEIASKIADRPGGYTRIIKMGNRLGDNAEMCLIELVDYNELLLKEDSTATIKTRRSRRGKKKGGEETVENEAQSTEKENPVEKKPKAKKAEEEVVEVVETVEESVPVVDEKVEEVKAEVEEVVEEEVKEVSTDEKEASSEEESGPDADESSNTDEEKKGD